ncbi:hypothetical protein SAY86_023717 [Trapa natans]|uniref:Uncharacterized protein n=1 Tax=Trapa natans TaxID=22666 RepID=A0AAN7M7S9_TRANT|nr:hypothetical protein SAY86_023717 [Trapa natans]
MIHGACYAFIYSAVYYPAELIMMHAGEHLADQWLMLAPSSGGRALLILFSSIHHSTLAWIVGAYAKCGIETAMIYVGGMPVDSSHHSSHAHRHFGLLLPADALCG